MPGSKTKVYRGSEDSPAAPEGHPSLPRTGPPSVHAQPTFCSRTAGRDPASHKHKSGLRGQLYVASLPSSCPINTHRWAPQPRLAHTAGSMEAVGRPGLSACTRPAGEARAALTLTGASTGAFIYGLGLRAALHVA